MVVHWHADLAEPSGSVRERAGNGNHDQRRVQGEA